MFLGVNIDHIAVLREARMVNDPDLIDALSIVKRANADQITIHLREDRRHVNDVDVKNIIAHSHLPINLECSINDEIIDIVLKLAPHRITLVPENRQEVTTEGGLDVEKNFDKIKKVIKRAKQKDIEVSLFVDPNEKSINVAKELKAHWVELHTGKFANIHAMLFSNISHTPYAIDELKLPRNKLKKLFEKSYEEIKNASNLATLLGLKVAAGHGLNYQNVRYITKIKDISELNIGQSIVARSVFVGLEKAIYQMKEAF